MPTTLHGKDVLEAGWRSLTQGDSNGDQVETIIAQALISIALSLRKIAASMNGQL